jgi:hypothetical protein
MWNFEMSNWELATVCQLNDEPEEESFLASNHIDTTF